MSTRLANGNTLIADNRGGRRVIEVRTSDYNASAPNWGYTESSIVWRYGTDGVLGTGPNQLVSPRSATRLANGNTLIADAGDRDGESNRVIEVTPSGGIAWQFGIAGPGVTDWTHTNTPSTAERLANGNTLISEEDGRRMIEVTPAGEIIDWYGSGEPMAAGGEIGKLRGAARTSSGTTMLCDQEHSRLIEIGFPASGTFESPPLGLGAAGYSAIPKVIHSIETSGSYPQGTSMTLAYRLDGGPWVETGATSVTLPPDTVASQVAYRLTLRTQSAAYTPIVRAVKFTFDIAPEPPDDSDDDTETPEPPDDSDDDTDAPDPGGDDSGNGDGGGESGNGDGSSGSGNGGGSARTNSSGGGSKPLAKVAGNTRYGVADAGEVIPFGADVSRLLRGRVLQAVAGRDSEGANPAAEFSSGMRAGGAVASTAAGATALVLGLSYAFGIGGDSLALLARAMARRIRPTTT